MEDFQVTNPAPAPAPGPEIEAQGSRLTGVLGALLGAIVGAVPWFLASAFTSFYVGWLGFIIGWASAFGYRKLKGRKSYGFAMCFVVVFSILALILAEFSSWMYLLCTDPEWQAEAANYGVPVVILVFFSLLMPENLRILLPNLGMGLLIGILGLLSVGRYVRQYTDPAGPIHSTDPQASWQAAKPDLALNAPGLSLPEQFTVRPPRAQMVVGILCCVFFGACFIAAAIVQPGWFLLCFAVFFLLGVYVLLTGLNRRVEVNGNWLSVKSTFGKVTQFQAKEIAGVSSAGQGVYVLLGQDGRKLFRVEQGMKNAPLLMQWLKEHDIPLKG